MKSSQILRELQELQKEWRVNDFNLSEGQQVTYNRLLELRRERVTQLYKENRVCKISKTAMDKLKEEEDT
jgi:chromosome segregation and condensation protein ScpB